MLALVQWQRHLRDRVTECSELNAELTLLLLLRVLLGTGAVVKPLWL